MLNLTFSSLKVSHFPLLLRWLEAPHVKKWWDHDITWTLELVQKKYKGYVQGYKINDEGLKKPVHAYIIEYNYIPIGYIQFYNAYDFARSAPLANLPPSLAAFDMFIGEKEYVGKGIGSQALKLFLETYIDKQYEYCFADPHANNLAAIRAYEKAGFKRIETRADLNEVWMLRKKLAHISQRFSKKES